MTAALSMPMWTLGGADLLEAAKVRVQAQLPMEPVFSADVPVPEAPNSNGPLPL